MALTADQRRVKEQCTAVYIATIKDENGTALTSGDLSTLTLTLYDKDTEAIINSRDSQDVLNKNGVTVGAAGALTWVMTPDDNVIVTTTSYAPGQWESHIALFEWTWSSSTKAGKYQVQIDVEQMAKVT
ncbi:hypothetical protein M0R72_07330 [Candidatus Pacearchaeota archaeon]|jgi:hypothetical protein|nr:hypothetical protein [Candidatus Pacearchaeota archaeon]